MKNSFKLLVGSVLLIGLCLMAWTFVIEPNRLTVKEYNLNVRSWSPQLNGFKIVAISDIHGGSAFIDEAKIRQIVVEANKQEPDIIVLLGDYISEQNSEHTKLKMPLEVVADNLRGLKAKYGVYAVLGNHDWLYGRQVVRSELEKIGCRVLEDEAVSFEKNGERIRLLGVVDGLFNNNWKKNNNAAKTALENLEPKDGKIIMLAHNPDAIDYLAKDLTVSSDAVLFLAGHTHGGQVRFPYIGPLMVPSNYGQKYAAGFIREKDIDMFVTTGIGTSILPGRFGVAPEISVLIINSGN